MIMQEISKGNTKYKECFHIPENKLLFYSSDRRKQEADQPKKVNSAAKNVP